MIKALTPLFTLADAQSQGMRKDQVYRLLEEGKLERVGRGVFMKPDSIDPSLIALAAATAIRPEATLCLTSALVYHDLVDTIPHGSDIALPRGTRAPAGISHAIWHSFDTRTFSIGRVELQNDAGLHLYVYLPERCIVDVFRLMHLEGQNTAITALKRWLARPGSSAGSLLEMARSFPKAEASLRQTLEVLL
ncbi:MAG: type IV toxin-antitoxin system AbiEi family antitoxin domain-containing protein [Coriobacteriales bacterium]|jgi:predicted transcriptional regulator of viral defense system|nr:type IV toxin-antitoxin system AbiEi family antitoxin domain-containing protein [Coriobacteriales bacterium]